MNREQEEKARRAVEGIMFSYPYLYVGIYGNLWVKRNGRDAESIAVSTINIYNPDYKLLDRLHETLKNMQPGYFWCTSCSQVTEQSKKAFNYFAGYYCKDCLKDKKEVQKIKKDEERETYD